MVRERIKHAVELGRIAAGDLKRLLFNALRDEGEGQFIKGRKRKSDCKQADYHFILHSVGDFSTRRQI